MAKGTGTRTISRNTSRRAKPICPTRSPARASMTLATRGSRSPSRSGSPAFGARNPQSELAERGQRALDLARSVRVPLLTGGAAAGSEPLARVVAAAGLDEHLAAHQVHGNVGRVFRAKTLEGAERV